MRETKPARNDTSDLPPLPDDLAIENMVKERYAGADARDVFSKVHEFTAVETAREVGVYPFFLPLDNNDGPEARVDGQKVLMFGSNNYLVLTPHPEDGEAARAAILKFGP